MQKYLANVVRVNLGALRHAGDIDELSLMVASIALTNEDTDGR